ncbi:hypothetical protein A9Q02_00020 [Candidatus Chloroploca asiatica]|uniref:Uncharacterized protein n=1 Tax=Candidatus Chloroploca asiatica TaxID=1506545 RepID=A0A2H3KN74_9CHLR|nr:hypothetical protein [Candidatus Chloroploca asiatica]PDV99648.1 hypothetical protein A9Q02_00020 [Candidatus Chloroploca asiatica]
MLVGLGAFVVWGQELKLPLLEDQLGAQPRQRLARPHSEQPVLPNLDEAFGQDVLEKSLHEHLRRQRADASLACRPILGAKRHLAIGHAQDAVVAQRHPEDVRGHILQRRSSTSDRAAVDHPVRLPDRSGDATPQLRLAQHCLELGAKEDGQRFDVDEEVGFGGLPGAPISG